MEVSYLLLLFLLIPISTQLKCTFCPSPVSSPSSCTQCDGDVCFIVVNAFFNGTLSAGCINLLEKDRKEFAEKRKECNREVQHDRTVCACNTGDDCNDPRTPLAQFDFISDSILNGYNLQPGIILNTAEPAVELPTDSTDEEIEDVQLLLTSTTSSLSASSSSSSSSSTSPSIEEMTTSTSTTTSIPLSTHRIPTSSTIKSASIDNEEGLIQVKSSVLIKPRNYSRIVPSSNEVTTNSSPPSTISPIPSTSHTREIARILPTDDAMPLSGVYKISRQKSEGKVLPTDSNEEESILIVKSGIMRVKEQEEIRKEEINRVLDVTEKSKEPELKETIRHPKGKGSVQDAEVSSGVTIGVGGNKPSSLKSSQETRRFSSRSDINSSISLIYPFYIVCLLFFYN